MDDDAVSPTGMCDVMPTIDEDSIQFPTRGFSDYHSGDASEEDLESLMVNMLDEREKFIDQIRELHDALDMKDKMFRESEQERKRLCRQLEDGFASSQDMNFTKEIACLREELRERTDDINDLKAERNNTKLLLEHLECLVARHERSIRLTVVKRQTTQGGVSSEVEVLKALKSLFEHHKALDEKVREKLRVALERCTDLQDDMDKLHSENDNLRMSVAVATEGMDSPAAEKRVNEMQSHIDSLKLELSESKDRVQEAMKRVRELEDEIVVLDQDLEEAKEDSVKHRRCLSESESVKTELEQKISSLEQKLLESQRDTNKANESTESFCAQLEHFKALLSQSQEKSSALQEKVDLTEARLMQSMKQAEVLPEFEDELQRRQDALIKAERMQDSVEEQITMLRGQLVEQGQELERTRQREKMNEEHNRKLTDTVDRLLQQGNTRLQAHLHEKMQVLEEKNVAIKDKDKTLQQLEDTQQDKQNTQDELCRLRSELDTTRLELRKMQSRVSMEIPNRYSINNIHPDVPDVVHRRCVRGRSKEDAVKTHSMNEREWEKQQGVLANVQQAFHAPSQDRPLLLDDLMDDQPIDPVPDMVPPSNQTDPHALAVMLQEQLEAINNEIRLIQSKQPLLFRGGICPVCTLNSNQPLLFRGRICPVCTLTSNQPHSQEEKESTEIRAEELESRVGSISLADIPSTTEGLPVPWSQSGLVQSTPNINSLAQSTVVQSAHTTPPFPTMDPPGERIPPAGAASVAEPMEDGFRPTQGGDSESSNGSTVNGSEESLHRIDTNKSLLYRQQSSTSNYQPFNRSYTLPAHLTPNTLHQFGKSKRSGLRGSIGKIFSGGKKDKLKVGSKDYLDQVVLGSSHDESTRQGQQRDFDRRQKKKVELLEEVFSQKVPFALWSGPTVVAWLELWVGMPLWYVAACRANVKSGAIMSGLTDSEIQREIGITNPLHRLKLRLAIKDTVNLTSPGAPLSPHPPPPLTSMNHEWVGNEWLPSLGLGQYRVSFMECLVDARMLEHLTKKDLRGALKVLDGFHRISIFCGISLLKKIQYDKTTLIVRRQYSNESLTDVGVWTCERVIRWLETIPSLKEYAANLVDSGVHGAVFKYDESFDHTSLLLALQVPNHNKLAHSALQREYHSLVEVIKKDGATGLENTTYKM